MCMGEHSSWLARKQAGNTMILPIYIKLSSRSMTSNLGHHFVVSLGIRRSADSV